MTDPADVPFVAVLGAVIALERRSRCASQSALARAAGVHPMALSKIERGVQTDIGVVALRRIAAGLSCVGAPIRAADLILRGEAWQAKLASELMADATPASIEAAMARIALRSVT